MIIFLIGNAILALPSAAINNRQGCKHPSLIRFGILLVGFLLIVVILKRGDHVYNPLGCLHQLHPGRHWGYALVGQAYASVQVHGPVISMQYFVTTLSAILGPNLSGWVEDNFQTREATLSPGFQVWICIKPPSQKVYIG